MASTKLLSLAQRDFLSLVTRAASVNPFSDEFQELQLKIAGCDASVPPAERVKLMVERWNEQLHKLQAAGVTSFKQVEGKEREGLRDAVLYEIYHRFVAAFDQLIAEQLSVGDRSVPVKFGSKALQLFTR